MMKSRLLFQSISNALDKLLACNFFIDNLHEENIISVLGEEKTQEELKHILISWKKYESEIIENIDESELVRISLLLNDVINNNSRDLTLLLEKQDESVCIMLSEIYNVMLPAFNSDKENLFFSFQKALLSIKMANNKPCQSATILSLLAREDYEKGRFAEILYKRLSLAATLIESSNLILIREINTNCKDLIHFCIKFVEFSFIDCSIKIDFRIRTLRELLDNISTYELQFLNHEIDVLLTDTIEKIKPRMQSSVSRNEEIYRGIKETAAEFGFSGFSKNFSDIAKEEKTASRFWLYVSGLLSFFSLSLIAVSVHQLLTTEIVHYQSAVTKTILTIIVTFMAFWASQQYAIAKRQTITYRHLAQVLSSLPWLLKQIGVDSGNLVLLETMKTVFPIPPLSAKADPAHSKILASIAQSAMNKVFEIQGRNKND